MSQTMFLRFFHAVIECVLIVLVRNCAFTPMCVHDAVLYLHKSGRSKTARARPGHAVIVGRGGVGGGGVVVVVWRRAARWGGLAGERHRSVLGHDNRPCKQTAFTPKWHDATDSSVPAKAWQVLDRETPFVSTSPWVGKQAAATARVSSGALSPLKIIRSSSCSMRSCLLAPPQSAPVAIHLPPLDFMERAHPQSVPSRFLRYSLCELLCFFPPIPSVHRSRRPETGGG